LKISATGLILWCQNPKKIGTLNCRGEQIIKRLDYISGHCLLTFLQVIMTDEQLETLRRQISVYATICQQLVEMHKASLANQPPPLPGKANVIILICNPCSLDDMET
jgi:hypothetical protein